MLAIVASTPSPSSDSFHQARNWSAFSTHEVSRLRASGRWITARGANTIAERNVGRRRRPSRVGSSIRSMSARSTLMCRSFCSIGDSIPNRFAP